MNTLIFNGRNLADFGVFVDHSRTFPVPERDVEFFDVPGRNGILSFDNGRFTDIDIVFPCFIRENFVTNYRNLEEYLQTCRGFCRLETSAESSHFRKGALVGGIQPRTTAFNNGGFFDLQFRCHPQRWLKSGETAVSFTANGTITNPTLFASKPLLRVYGKGAFVVGNTQITISDFDTYTDINCDLMECYKGATDCSEFVTISGNDFPVLQPGSNQVQLGSGITKIEITPRWFAI